MKLLTPQQIGSRRNTLLRYKDMVELYLEKKEENKWITDLAIHKLHIYPRFKFSRKTMYTALATPIDRDLKKLDEMEEMIASNQLQLAF